MDEKTLIVTGTKELTKESGASIFKYFIPGISENPKLTALICLGVVATSAIAYKYGDNIIKYGSEFFKGRSFKRDKEGNLESKPEHTTTVETGDNKSRTKEIDNLAVGTNPSLKTGKNTAEEGVNNTAFDKDTPQTVMDFLSKRHGK